MERCYHITLDLYQQKNYSNLIFYRLDRGNSLSVSFEEKGQPLSLHDKTVLVKWQDTYRLNTRIEGDRVLVPMDGAALSTAGRQELVIGLYDSENALTVQKIYYQVLEGLGDMDNIPDQPVEETVIGQLINDMTAVNTAEETRESNEAARKQAEVGRISAEQSRSLAEDARKQAEESRVSSEQQRQTAEQERTKAYETAEAQRETLYTLAEDNRDARYQSAETARDLSYATAEDNRDSLYQSAETLRENGFQASQAERNEAFESARQQWKPEHDAAYQAAENERNQFYTSAENNRDERYATEESFRSNQFAQQEENRQAAENERQQSEDDRNSAEKLRGDAEEERITQESNRVFNEKERNYNEADRVKAETARETAEEERRQKEQARTDAESARAAAETARTTAEQERQTAEMQRQENEETRQAAYLGMNKTFASAISNSVSGETISVNDASPVEHPLDVTVQSKNLLKITSLYRNSSDYGVTFTLLEDMGVHISGTSEGGEMTYNLLPVPDLPIGTYTFCMKDKSAANCSYLSIYVFMLEDGVQKYYGGLANPITVEVTENKRIQYLQIRVRKNNPVDEILYFQLEEGETATEYTPYISDLSAVKVSRYGKNLFDVGEIGDYSCYGTSVYSYYIEGNNIGTTPVSRSAMNYVLRENTSYHPGTYTLSGCFTNNTTEKANPRLIFRLFDKDGNILTEHGVIDDCNYNTHYKGHHKIIYNTAGRFSYTLTVPNTVAYWQLGFAFGVDASSYSGNAEGNIEYSNIQLETGSTATEYVPYAGTQTVTANPDGTVEGLTSVAPNMTLLSDTPGVIMDVTYNADTKTYIDQKIASLQALLLEE